jgi:hypothetical protein
MKKQRQPLRPELAPEQVEKIKRATGKDAELHELDVEELEERIAPGGGGTVGGGGTHP